MPPMPGMVVAQAAAVGVDRQLAAARAQAAVATNAPPLPFSQKPRSSMRLDDGDGERVVDRGVVDVLRRDAGLLEGARAGPARAGVGQVDVAVVGVLRRLALAQDLDVGAAEVCRATSGLATTIAPPPSVTTQAVQPVQRVAEHAASSDVLDRDRLPGAGRAGCTGRAREAATLTQASCSLVVPNSYMWRWAASAYMPSVLVP